MSQYDSGTTGTSHMRNLNMHGELLCATACHVPTDALAAPVPVADTWGGRLRGLRLSSRGPASARAVFVSRRCATQSWFNITSSYLTSRVLLAQHDEIASPVDVISTRKNYEGRNSAPPEGTTHINMS